jgi:uncharacterized protein YgbK (DUF1537 family)
MHNTSPLDAAALTRLPPVDERRLEADYQSARRSFARKIVVLDDDPTGVQTVHGVSVYTDWSQEALDSGFSEENRLFFILTNSRAMDGETTVREHRAIGRRIAAASRRTGKDYVVVSRSDSTLRGHYPAETAALRQALEAETGRRFDGEILCPFFAEGGRYTLEDVHYVKEGDRLVPAGQTEFARDKTFGYAASNLADWCEEKTGGDYPAENVISIPLALLRALDYDEIVRRLLSARNFTKIIVNAAAYSDVKAFTVACVRALQSGHEWIFRSAAAIPKVLGGIDERPLLTRTDMVAEGEQNGGIVLIGSHVQKTTKQLEALQKSKLPLRYGEFDVTRAGEPGGLRAERRRLAAFAQKEIALGHTPVLYTSRKVLAPADRERALQTSVAISEAFTGIVADLEARPSFLIAKGGITSSDVGTKALRVRRAVVLGQILPGVPVWQTGSESKFPNLPYVIFPGNVGSETALREIVETLIG